jgi:peptidoglycan/LPS O-acetylase OafA/YrhL
LSAGVDLFFVISGFVMVYSSERLFGAQASPGIFMRHRVARIVPLYWIVTTIWLLTGTPFDWVNLIGSYSFIPFVSEITNQPNPYYGLGWTLNFEMMFYVVFASCLQLRKAVALALAAALLLGLVAVGRLVELPYSPLTTWTNPLILEFLAGGAIALLHRRGVMLPAVARVAMIAVALVTIGQFHVAELEPARWAEWGIPAAAIVAATVLGRNPWADLRVGKVAAALGDASYSLYLLHQLPYYVMVRVAAEHGAPRLLWIGIVASIVLSLACYRYFERPVTNFLKGRAVLGSQTSLQPVQ